MNEEYLVIFSRHDIPINERTGVLFHHRRVLLDDLIHPGLWEVHEADCTVHEADGLAYLSEHEADGLAYLSEHEADGLAYLSEHEADELAYLSEHEADGLAYLSEHEADGLAYLSEHEADGLAYLSEHEADGLAYLSEHEADGLAYLSEHGLIHLIVTMSSVGYEVNHHVLTVLVSPLCCYVTHMHHSLRVICIHMEDWGLHYL